MSFNQLRLRSKHILLLAIVLVIFAGLFSSHYMSKIMTNVTHKEAVLLLNDALSKRALLIQAAYTKNSTDFMGFFNEFKADDPKIAGLTLNLSLLRSSTAIRLPVGYKLSASRASEWLDILINHDALRFETYLPSQKRWLIITLKYDVSSLWYDAAVILLMILLLFLLLLLGFVLHYRYMLVHELMFSIKQPQSETTGRAPTLIRHLRQQIKNYYEEKNIMITALAHDIKTPLTEAMLKLEILGDPAMTDSIKQNLDKINAIVKSSLDYAEQPDKLKKANVEVVSLVENVADGYKSEVFDILLIKKVSACEVQIEVALFKRMVSNLIENAKKYATSCELIITQTEKYLQIICQDDGPGVPEAFIQLLAIPYFRVDQARTSDTGGSGLGLAIVKKIIELHSGSIDFENRQGGGFRAILNLPLEESK